MLDPVRVLVAFPYANATVMRMLADAGEQVEVMIDSGAFTAWKGGKAIELADYVRFLREMPVKPLAYMTLDVVGDPHATRANFMALREQGLTPMPVFTRGESIDVAREYLQQSDLIAIGGVAGIGQDPRPYVRHVEQQLGGLSRCHLLGFTRTEWLKHLRPFSADASSWESARRYAQVAVYMGHGRMWRASPKTISSATPEAFERARMMGFDLAKLRTADAWRGGRSLSGQITTASFVWWSHEVRRHLGTRLFYGFTTDMALRLLLEAHARLAANGLLRPTAKEAT